jgi:CheY-like chemotaxis protein
LSAGVSFDILITDINLPDLDGAALARRAGELRPNLPVVYVSGSYRRLAEMDAVPGAVLVAKPYNPDKLCDMIGRLAASAA